MTDLKSQNDIDHRRHSVHVLMAYKNWTKTMHDTSCYIYILVVYSSPGWFSFVCTVNHNYWLILLSWDWSQQLVASGEESFVYMVASDAIVVDNLITKSGRGAGWSNESWDGLQIGISLISLMYVCTTTEMVLDWQIIYMVSMTQLCFVALGLLIRRSLHVEWASSRYWDTDTDTDTTDTDTDKEDKRSSIEHITFIAMLTS